MKVEFVMLPLPYNVNGLSLVYLVFNELDSAMDTSRCFKLLALLWCFVTDFYATLSIWIFLNPVLSMVKYSWWIEFSLFIPWLCAVSLSTSLRLMLFLAVPRIPPYPSCSVGFCERHHSLPSLFIFSIVNGFCLYGILPEGFFIQHNEHLLHM